MDKKKAEDRVFLQQTNFSCGFVFESPEASLSIFAPSASEAAEILQTLISFKKIQTTLGFEPEENKGR